MIQFSRFSLGRGARAAHQPLELWILVRIQAPQSEPPTRAGGNFSLSAQIMSAHRPRASRPVLL